LRAIWRGEGIVAQCTPLTFGLGLGIEPSLERGRCRRRLLRTEPAGALFREGENIVTGSQRRNRKLSLAKVCSQMRIAHHLSVDVTLQESSIQVFTLMDASSNHQVIDISAGSLKVPLA